jgi:molybdopterin synthase catalytic subunit
MLVNVRHEHDSMSREELAARTSVEVSDGAIDPADLIGRVGAPGVGGMVLFLGTVRDHSEGREGVTGLEYEAYAELVEGRISAIVAEAGERWPITAAAVRHRVGFLPVGEIAVGVAVGSAHRADAFAAGRYLIDELKHRAPIWKKEHWPGGAEWVREGDHGTG